MNLMIKGYVYIFYEPLTFEHLFNASMSKIKISFVQLEFKIKSDMR